jgi:hypothetical protein
VLRRIFGMKRDEVTEGWRQLHNEKLHNLQFSPCIIRMIKSGRVRRTGPVECMGAKMNAYKILLGKRKRKSPLGRHRCRWDDNIKLDLGERGWGGID